VLQRAWNRGLIEPNTVPSDDVINMMIFEPGFSTAEQVTNLSGRGVGMDVVRRNIESLRGSIKLDSRPGRGLQVDIRLPLDPGHHRWLSGRCGQGQIRVAAGLGG
jgi:two-component system chemotaxis sensor kinase CheA